MSSVKEEEARRLSAGVLALIRVIEQLRSESAARQGFSDLEFRVLVRAAGSGEPTTDEIARELRLPVPEVQTAMDALVASGHLRSRGLSYGITAPGEKVARAAVDGLASTVAAALGPASDDEAKQLVLLIDLTTRMLSQSLETRPAAGA